MMTSPVASKLEYLSAVVSIIGTVHINTGYIWLAVGSSSKIREGENSITPL